MLPVLIVRNTDANYSFIVLLIFAIFGGLLVYVSFLFGIHLYRKKVKVCAKINRTGILIIPLTSIKLITHIADYLMYCYIVLLSVHI